MAMNNPSVLLGTTPKGNNCLHISSIHGHEKFCKDAVDLNPSLLTAVNMDGETPLLASLTSGHTSLASFFLTRCSGLRLKEAMLTQDMNGCNALHHAIRSGHTELALELIAAEPDLSHAVNKYNESPMFIAVLRGFTDVFVQLLKIPNSADAGACGYNALHGAVKNESSVIAKMIVEERPWLARQETDKKKSPMKLAVNWDRVDVLRVLLEYDWSLGHVVSSDGSTLLHSAAYQGHVSVARMLLDHCPDAPYSDGTGWTCLHEAVCHGRMEFVQFILESPHLRKLVNMRDANGRTALHHAVQRCNPKIVAALLFHNNIDFTMLGNNSRSATWELYHVMDHAKTLNWNEVYMLMMKADSENTTSLYNLHRRAREKVSIDTRKDVKSLTTIYTSNTSLVAILIATITFAAAFTLPGGYSSDAESQGLPIMARKLAFQAFLISDTLAMCSSLAVAFICVIARWEDLEFLVYYTAFTKKLMWFAYMSTTTAFATGLYTVLAPHLLWLAVTTCVLMVLLPALTKLLGEWPTLKLRFRLGQTFKSELLDMV
ncbi:unnamed protein product [Urochloa humidicola]